jgi:hypothetical protein
MPSNRYLEIVEELKTNRGQLQKAEVLSRIAQLKAERDAAAATYEQSGSDDDLQNTKPDYISVLTLVEAETDPEVKAQLREEAYTFNAPLTDEEKSAFSYIPFGYIENNPGYNEEGEWTSFIGSFPNPDTGEYS